METKKNFEMMVNNNIVPHLNMENSNSETPVLDMVSDMLGMDAIANPSITFYQLFFHKECFTKEGILDATGLSERWYNMVVDEHYRSDLRMIRTSSNALQTLEKHLERKDLRIHQRLICELFWKHMMFLLTSKKIMEFTQKDAFSLTVEDVQNEAFDLTQYLISVEELEEACNFLFAHIILDVRIDALRQN